MSESIIGTFAPRLARRRMCGAGFVVACALASGFGIAVLTVLLIRVGAEGGSWISWKFLSGFPSVLTPERSGLKNAIAGTLWLVALTALFAIPVGVAAAIYLVEYAGRSRWTRLVHLNIANLAGVPSIVYGILGLAVFVRWLRFDRSVLAGALTMALLILPVIIIATREALAAVPGSIRSAAFALGATRWQTIWHHVLPAALPGILTGTILALSRAIGETAPLIMIGALTFIQAVPEGPLDEFTVLPIQIYNWVDQPQPEFHHLAAAGIIVLLGILLPMNALAVGIRAWQQRKQKW